MRIAVAGGTGWVGKLVVMAAEKAGHTPVVMARSTGVDLTTGAGLDAALAGADAVIDVSNVVTTSKAKSVAFFEAATTNLLRASEKAGVGHLVALSIVGCDRVGFPYYAGKVRQEELLLAGSVPATIQRATQFHEFAEQMLGNAVGPFVPIPKMLCQPIAAREVAEFLIEVAAAAPQGRAADLAGPAGLRLEAMVRALIREHGLRKRVVPIPLGKAALTGGLLPAGPGPRGTETFESWLAAR